MLSPIRTAGNRVLSFGRSIDEVAQRGYENNEQGARESAEYHTGLNADPIGMRPLQYDSRITVDRWGVWVEKSRQHR